MPDFCKRTQKFWISEMGGYDTKQARGAIIKKIRAEAEKHLHLPEKCKDSIVEPIDPVIMINDLVGAMSQKVIFSILDFKPLKQENIDTEFIDKMRYLSEECIMTVIEEIEEGFTDGFDGVKVFLEENMKALIATMCAPH